MTEDRFAEGVLILGYLSIIVMRILNVINWSWLWILCPFWLPIAGIILGIILGIIIGIPFDIYTKIKEKRENERN